MTRANLRIRFFDVGKTTPDSRRPRVWQPFRLEIYNRSGRLVFQAAVSHDDLLPVDQLKEEIGKDAVSAAIVRWAIRRTEHAISSGGVPETREVLELELEESELPLIVELASAKSCDYQISRGRDLFCIAADMRADETRVSEEGARALAPTSRPLCRSCELPDTDFICSHLLFPKVVGSTMVEGGTPESPVPVFRRRLLGSFCDVDEKCVGTGANCRPGGNPCWERLVSPEARRVATPASPRELPAAFDFLDATWRLAFGRSLLRIRSAESVAGLVLPCSTREEFAQRLSELADLIKLLQIADDLLPDNKKTLTKSETLNRLKAALVQRVGEEEAKLAEEAIRTLHAINKARWAHQHSAASRDLIEALTDLGIDYPIEDYGQAWDAVRTRTVESLSVIRKVVRSGEQ